MQVKSCSCDINNNIKKRSEKEPPSPPSIVIAKGKTGNSWHVILTGDGYSESVTNIADADAAAVVVVCYSVDATLFSFIYSLILVSYTEKEHHSSHAHTIAYAIPIRSTLSFSLFACCVHTVIKSYYIY